MKKCILIFCCVSIFNLAYANPPAVCPSIVSRQQWDARHPKFIYYTVFPLDFIVIHHTVTESCSNISSCSNIVASIQSYQIDKLDFDDIGYNFLVGGDGNVYEGRGWHKQGAHTRGYNTNSIGIGFIGTFSNLLPTDKQLQAAEDFLKCGVEMGELSEDYKLYGARQVSSTESPGIKLFDKIRRWTHFSRPDQ